jgi:aryl-alcohol dehydrogenase-like predicted oxidoreductase
MSSGEFAGRRNASADRVIQRLSQIARYSLTWGFSRQANASVARVALAWLLQRKGVMSIIYPEWMLARQAEGRAPGPTA